ncbi:aminotransferase class IV [Aeromicrobium sp.]|uniref:aminotransferase class IV n=1 Tax=Aeromicrobium sp. TaxID=1871063 RepID=UPI0019C0B4B2|nr:aminotransferase class IV [Aeromicrobium sp.]MBC7631718.1 aminotransferase class IV [Aeromicrobium sp.]
MKTWLNGHLLQSPDEPAISALDHGMIVGDGVFETIQISANQPFALTRHLDRLVRSARGLGIGKPDLGAVREGIAATMHGQDIPFGRIRVTVTSGPGPLGSPRGNAGLTQVVIAEASERPPPVASIPAVAWPRNERGALAGLKTTSYAENALMVEHAQARGASEAVMPNPAGMLCEGTGSNIMYVVNDQLITPTLDAGPLAGVTRALVLEWCAGEIDVVERDAPIDILQTADEVILVGTTRDVQAIERVDDRLLDAPGPITQRAQEIWAREAAKNIDP